MLMNEYYFKKIDIINEDVFAIYQSNDAYFMMSEKRCATMDDVKYNYHALPKCSHKIQKYFVSIQNDDEMIGVVDFLLGYPHKECIYIGLFMLHQKWQHQHIGTSVIQKIQNTMHQYGYKEIKLGVLKENKKAFCFWEKMHFQKQDETIIKNNGGNDVEVIRMYWKEK